MAIQLRTTLKGYFQSGNIPVEQHYIDIIDSALSISESNSGNIDLIGNITASGNISSSGTTGQHTFGGTIFDIKGNISASGDISSSGAITASGANIFGNITASGNVKCGNFDVGGSVSATNASYTYISGSRLTLANPNSQLSLGGTSLTTTFAELNYLDGLTSANGTYVKAMNQGVTTTSSPTFTTIRLTRVAGDSQAWGSTVTLSDTVGYFELTGIPTLEAKQTDKISRSPQKAIEADNVTANSIIIMQVQGLYNLHVIVTNIQSGSFRITLVNEGESEFTAGSITVNYLILVG